MFEVIVGFFGVVVIVEGFLLIILLDVGAGEGVGEGEGVYISFFGIVLGGVIRGVNCGGFVKIKKIFIKVGFYFYKYDVLVY